MYDIILISCNSIYYSIFSYYLDITLSYIILSWYYAILYFVILLYIVINHISFKLYCAVLYYLVITLYYHLIYSHISRAGTVLRVSHPLLTGIWRKVLASVFFMEFPSRGRRSIFPVWAKSKWVPGGRGMTAVGTTGLWWIGGATVLRPRGQETASEWELGIPKMHRRILMLRHADESMQTIVWAHTYINMCICSYEWNHVYVCSCTHLHITHTPGLVTSIACTQDSQPHSTHFVSENSRGRKSSASQRALGRRQGRTWV